MKAARVYGELGWAIVPIHDVKSGACSCGKSECRSQGKHPRINNWAKRASKDAEQIAEWIEQYPSANVGVATGEASGFFVLDVDPEHDGDKTLEALIAEHGPMPETIQAVTGSGGTHYLFKLPNFPVTNKAGKFNGRKLPGLDIRGDGGQIVVAPSRSAKGLYRWVEGRQPGVAEILPAPQWLLDLLTPDSSSAPTAITPAPRVMEFPPATAEDLQSVREALASHGPAVDGQGGGLHTVQACAIATHDFALKDDEAWPLLVEWNQTNEPPWDLEGGTEASPDLRIMLARGRKYGKAEYGCKRKVDSLGAVDAALEKWRAEGSNENAIPALIENVREIVARGVLPSERALIETKIEGATGLGPRAQAMPAAKKRVIVGEIVGGRYDFDTNAQGQPLMNLKNVVHVLQVDAFKLSFDTFLQRIVKEDGSEWTDADTLRLNLHLESNAIGLKRVTPQMVMDAVATYARSRETNCVLDYLNGLTWDGTPRIAGFMTRVFGAEDSEYTRCASQNFWCSMVARALRPGCKVDNMIVLEGQQGIFKSSALKFIASPPWFAEAAESPHSKDFFQGLHGKLIVEIAELDSFSRADVTAVKRVLSCQVDRFRPPFGRVSQDFPRQGIFAGTTNIDTWSRDDTGARRFWPVKCSRVDIECIKANRDQLFAEAVHAIHGGAKWWEMPQEETLRQQEARRQADPWETILERFIRDSDQAEFVATDLLSEPLGLEPSRMSKSEQMRIATVLRRIGMQRMDVWKGGRHRKVWRKPRS